MADDMSSKVMEILSNPEMMQKLNSVIGSLGAGSDAPQSQSDTSNIEASAKSIMSSINRSDDRRITLLNALRPYLRESRASEVDKAIKMLRLTKLTEIFKNEGL